MAAVEERITVVREFSVELAEAGDGRTIDTRIVPFNTPTLVADPPDFRPYRESWLPGAFEAQVAAAHRVKVWLNFEHEDGLRGIVGHGATLEERDDALYGSFRVHENADGDKALQLVHDGLLTGISLEAVAIRSRRVNGVVERVRGHLDKVSLCRFPAFQQAGVLAVREQPLVELPVIETKLADELAGRLEAIGYQPLERMSVTTKPWDGSAARFDDEQYQRSTLFCRAGDAPPKERCSLPVLEPNGDLNTNALSAAAGRIGQVQGLSGTEKAAVARKLIRYYRMAEMEPPNSLVRLAQS